MKKATAGLGWWILFALVTPAAAPPDQALRGTVTAADSSPAAGAIVWAARRDHGPLERRETKADAQGRFRLDLGPGEWFVWARLGTQGGEGPARHEMVIVPAGRDPAPLAFGLAERGRLRGRLLEAETGKPIPGGRLALDSGLVLAADAQGRFEVGGLSRGYHESFVVCPGRVRQRVLFDTTAKADTELDIPVPRGGKVVGRVTDADGRPIPGTYVGRPTSGRFVSINALYERCDEQGRFVYEGVTFDQRSRLLAYAPGFEEDEQEGWRAADGERPPELVFRLRPKPAEKPAARPAGEPARRTVRGRVRGPNAEPVAGATVRWGVRPYVGSPETRTEKDGTFRLSLIPDEPGQLAVEVKGLAPAFPKVPAGGNQDVSIDLGAGQVFQGVVQDADAEPFPGVLVIPVIPSPETGIGNPHWLREHQTVTDARGRFRLKGVPEGALFDFLREGLSDLRSQPLPADGSRGLVVMQAEGAIRGQVVDQGGRAVRNFRVLINIPHERKPDEQAGGFFAGYCGIGVRFTSDDGTFVVTGLTTGHVHRVSAVPEGYREAIADRVIAEPLNRLSPAQKLTLRAGAPVALRVRAVTAGRPIERARVTLINGAVDLDKRFSWGYHDAAGWEDRARARTDAKGWASFPAMTFIGATLLVEAPGFGRRRLGWRGDERELTVELEPEAVLTGTIRDGDGLPLREGYVNLLGQSGDQLFTAIGPADAGKFRLAELPAGEYTLRVHKSNETLHQEQVTLKAGVKLRRSINLPGRAAQ
jgi:protocatechuate 3,4-dioxygenase beta subunit